MLRERLRRAGKAATVAHRRFIPAMMARSLGTTIEDVEAELVRRGGAGPSPSRTHIYVILKGHTFARLTATPWNGTVYINPTGNPGMARAEPATPLTG